MAERKTWKLVERLLWASGLFFALCFASLLYRYAKTRPSVANERVGSVYPLGAPSGRVVYLTRTEWFRVHVLEGAAFGCGICFGVGILLQRKRVSAESAQGAAMIPLVAKQRRWMVVARGIGIAGILVMISLAYLSYHYADSRPTVAQEQVGRIILSTFMVESFT
jgi:hypothetical protein